MADGADLEEARAEAAELVEDAFQWRLTPARWNQVESILDVLIEALHNGDESTIRVATADLELAGPVRVGRLGDAQPTTDPVRDRLNETKHLLGDVDAEDGPSTDSDQPDGR